MNILKVATKTTRYAYPDGNRRDRYYITRKAKRMIKDDTRKTFSQVMAEKLA